MFCFTLQNVNTEQCLTLGQSHPPPFPSPLSSLQCLLISSLIIHLGRVFNPGAQVFNLPAGTEKFCTFGPQLISSSVCLSSGGPWATSPWAILWQCSCPRTGDFLLSMGKKQLQSSWVICKSKSTWIPKGEPQTSVQTPGLIPGQELPAHEGLWDVGAVQRSLSSCSISGPFPAMQPLSNLQTLGAIGRSQKDPWSTCGHSIWNKSFLTSRFGRFYQSYGTWGFSRALTSLWPLGRGACSRGLLSAGLLFRGWRERGPWTGILWHLSSSLLWFSPCKHLSNPTGCKAGAQEC